MIQFCHRARLALQASPGLGFGQEVRMQNLDRHLTTQLLVVGAVDHGHAALADLLNNAIACWQGFRKHHP